MNPYSFSYSEQKPGRIYQFAAVFLLVICAANLALLSIIYANSKRIYSRDLESIQHMSTINDELSDINENVLSVVSTVFLDTGSDPLNEIKNAFNVIRVEEEAYEQIKGRSETEQRRYHQAKLAIQSYNSILQDQVPLFEKGDFSTARLIYTQEIIPLQNSASEMLTAAMEIRSRNAEESVHQNAVAHGLGLLILLTFFVLGELAILYAYRRAQDSSQEIKQNKYKLAAADRKLEHSKQKVHDIAMRNILTRMKNRYALESDLADSLETDVFSIAVFDTDKFHRINDAYGYSFGDEYLAAVADRLISEFGDHGTLYNITGSEFCIIFNKDIPEPQAEELAEAIRLAMCDDYTVSGINIHMKASGSILHYRPDECPDVSALLMKLDTAMRQIKKNGGGSLCIVTQP